MGGTGSGRRYQGGKNTINDMLAIDVRYLQRKGLLTSGRISSLEWSRCGVVIASIQIFAKSDCLTLSYRYQKQDGNWQNMNYPIRLEKTNCNLGEHRVWFRCPVQRCGKRVAILYGGQIFGCRHCQQLTYASTRESVDDRAARKADRIRDTLEWEPGILNGNGIKPKGMHWETFYRLQAKHDSLVNQSLAGIAERFKLFDMR